MDKAALRAAAALLALVIVAILRGAHLGVYSSPAQAIFDVSLLAGSVTLVYSFFRRVDSGYLRLGLQGVCLAPAVYVAVNVVLHARGLAGATAIEAAEPAVAAGAPAQILGFLGISATRVQYPLANGVNNFGDVAGAGLAASGALALLSAGRMRRAAAAAAIVCLWGLLATDARAALFVSLGVIPLVLALRKRKAAAGLVLLIPVAPGLTLIALAIIANTGLVDSLSRSGTDLATGTNRLYIWQAVLQHLRPISLEAFYGYGANGHVTSGTSIHYAYLFRSLPDATRYTTHNLALQSILDAGYLGLASIVISFFITARRLLARARDGLPETTALFAVVIFFVIVGATEGAPWIYTPEALLYFLMVVAAAAGAGTPLPTDPT